MKFLIFFIFTKLEYYFLYFQILLLQSSLIKEIIKFYLQIILVIEILYLLINQKLLVLLAIFQLIQQNICYFILPIVYPFSIMNLLTWNCYFKLIFFNIKYS